jgi:hypothetical protein
MIAIEESKAERKAARIRKAKEQAESIARMNAIRLETQRIVATGKCPKCGSALKRNFSLTGWWQCEQNGAEMFRKRPDEPSCSWQGFTE